MFNALVDGEVENDVCGNDCVTCNSLQMDFARINIIPIVVRSIYILAIIRHRFPEHFLAPWSITICNERINKFRLVSIEKMVQAKESSNEHMHIWNRLPCTWYHRKRTNHRVKTYNIEHILLEKILNSSPTE